MFLTLGGSSAAASADRERCFSDSDLTVSLDVPFVLRAYKDSPKTLRAVTWLAPTSQNKSALIAAAGDDKRIRIWCLPDDRKAMRDPRLPLRKATRSMKGHTGSIHLLHCSPALPDLIASAASDLTLRLWSIETRRQLLQLDTTESGSSTSIAVSSAHKSLFFGSAVNPKISVADMATGEITQQLSSVRSRNKKRSRGTPARHRSSESSCEVLEHSELDPSILYSGHLDGAIKVWDIRSRSPLQRTLRAPSSSAAVSALSFSPFTNSLLVGDSQGVVYLWDLRSTQLKRRMASPIETFRAHASPIVSIASDWRRMVSCSADSAVLLWDLHDSQAPASIIKASAGPSLPTLPENSTAAVAASLSGSLRPFSNGLEPSSQGVRSYIRPAIDPSCFRMIFPLDRTLSLFCPASNLSDQQSLSIRSQALTKMRINKTRSIDSDVEPSKPHA